MKRILAHNFLIAILFVFASLQLKAQDPHFTQFSRIPTFYNPASAGQDVEHIRLTMLYRNQWSSVTSPFVTQSVFFDKQVSKVGLGANIINNSSGDAGIRQLYLNGLLSYRLTFGKHQIATGLQLGLIQKSFDPSKMTFDDQYSPDQGYNAANPTSETFSYTKLTRPDFGAGFLWTYGKLHESKLHPYLGASFQHINQPKETFIEEPNIIPRKMTMQGGVGMHISSHLELTPMFVFQQQQSARELMYGVMAMIPLQDRSHFETGIFHRTNDAVAIYAGYRINSFMFGASYDVNISGLTGGPGGFELTLTYIPKAKVKKEPEAPVKKKKDPKPGPESRSKSSETKTVPSSSSRPMSNATVVLPKEKPKTVKGKEESAEKPVIKYTAKPKSTISETKAAVVTLPVAEKKVEIADRDKDGVEDKNDACPDQAGEVSAKGCPVIIPGETNIDNADSDQDGIPDVKDACPFAAGKDGKACPDSDQNLDSDADGVPDKTDACPYIKGTAATHGCPDTDADGIEDSKDECPFAKGENGKACPEKTTGEITAEKMEFGNIEFETNSVKVNGVFKLDIIEPALDSAIDNNDYTIIITGHTDGEGDAAYNMVLSQLRANTVKEIFARKGMDRNRMRTVAYGEAMPIRDNISVEGRARNRRVEIHIIKNSNQ